MDPGVDDGDSDRAFGQRYWSAAAAGRSKRTGPAGATGARGRPPQFQRHLDSGEHATGILRQFGEAVTKICSWRQSARSQPGKASRGGNISYTTEALANATTPREVAGRRSEARLHVVVTRVPLPQHAFNPSRRRDLLMVVYFAQRTASSIWKGRSERTVDSGWAVRRNVGRRWLVDTTKWQKGPRGWIATAIMPATVDGTRALQARDRNTSVRATLGRSDDVTRPGRSRCRFTG